MQNHRMRFARAGHCPVLYYKAAEHKIHLLQPPGIAVGLDNGVIFERMLQEYQINVNPGDVFLLYTDGLSEAMNSKNEEYGEKRLAKVVRENHQKPVAQLKQTIIDDVFLFTGRRELQDDLTFVLVKREN